MRYRILQFTNTGTYTYRIDDPDGTSVYQSATQYLSADEATEMAGEFIAQRLSEPVQQAGQQLVVGVSNYIGTLIGLLALQYARHPQDIPTHWR